MVHDRLKTGGCGHRGALRPWPRAAGRRARRAVGLGCAVALVGPALAISAPAASAPTIAPAHGQPFRPTLGDWEGTVNGFPVSFELGLTGSATTPHYAVNAIVALIPSGCPAVAYDYSEAVIDSQNGSPVGTKGQLSLTKFGYTGGFTGARTATLSTHYGAHRCGQLNWTLHPAHRTAVQSGTWRLTFANGESSRFSVIGTGRLATGISLPRALATCNGTRGTIDLFITAAGRAATARPTVRASFKFTHTKATGHIDAGGKGCSARSLAFTAKRLSS